MTYAFTFDASACSGCKACQIACKDKNKLPAGVLWRRVYEVTGGTWEQRGNAWVTDVFAYNLSVACNHCVHPKCAGVCPTDAYVQREDGIVYIDESRCMGCGYCNWACPYHVPQYDPEKGHMTKCDFCRNELDTGLLPTCVSACPMRVLDFVDSSSAQWLGEGIKQLWKIPASEHPFPMPDFSRTEPHLALKPHSGMLNALEKRILNLEEVDTVKTKSDIPLVVFTLLCQMAVGAFLATQWMFKPLWGVISYDAMQLRLLPYLLIGGFLGIAVFFSFAHLGVKRNAWRALTHLRKSWLSREVLFLGLFGMGWAVSTLLVIFRSWLEPVFWLTTILGLGLVYSMARVYRLRSIPAWDTWRTNAKFFVTALLTGLFFMAFVLVFESNYTGINLPPTLIKFIMCFSVVLQTVKFGLHFRFAGGKYILLIRNRLIFSINLVGFILSIVIFISPNQFKIWTAVVIILIIIIEEILDRWFFYEARKSNKSA